MNINISPTAAVQQSTMTKHLVNSLNVHCQISSHYFIMHFLRHICQVLKHLCHRFQPSSEGAALVFSILILHRNDGQTAPFLRKKSGSYYTICKTVITLHHYSPKCHLSPPSGHFALLLMWLRVLKMNFPPVLTAARPRASVRSVICISRSC